MYVCMHVHIYTTYLLILSILSLLFTIFTLFYPGDSGNQENCVLQKVQECMLSVGVPCSTSVCMHMGSIYVP